MLTENDKEEYLHHFYEDAHKNCKHLYEDGCGWECNSGWNELLHNFSVKCEELTLRFYKKYRYIINADQIKQKYANLDIYCSIQRDPCSFLKFIHNIVSRIHSKIWDNVHFDCKTVEDTPSYKKHIINIFNSEESRKKSGFLDCENVKKYDVNGKFVKITSYDVYGTRHYEPTKHKILYHIMQLCGHLADKISSYGNRTRKESADEYIVRNYMNDMMNKYIDEASKEAENTCEYCGNHFNDYYSKRCETLGWIMNVCESCAKKSGREYVLGDKVYKNGEFVRDVKQDWKGEKY